MTIETDLSRLTAGLDRDAEIARAAGERATEWRSDGKGVAGGPFTPADPEWEITEQGTHTIVYDEGWPLATEALHIAAQDPRTTLLRVEAIRKVLARHHPETVSGVVVHLGDPGRGAVQVCAGCGNRGNGFGYTAWPCPDIQDLAGIYTAEEKP